MSMLPEEIVHEKLTECQYSFPVETLNDIRRVRAAYTDLRLYVDFYSGTPGKSVRKLLYLAGTIPVLFEENQYNIPVCIWLHETHPVNRPRCSICPSVSMVINPMCPWVDASGVVSLPYLTNWTHGVSGLLQLITEMRWAFQKHTPLYARKPVPNTTSPAIEHRGPMLLPGQHGQRAPEANSGSISSQMARCSLADSQPSQHRGSQSEPRGERRLRKSYTEELLGIDFSTPASSNPFLSTTSSTPQPLLPTPSADSVSLQLTPGRGHLIPGGDHLTPGRGHLIPGGGHLTPGRTKSQAEELPTKDHATGDSQPARPKLGQILPSDSLPPDKVAMFWSLVNLKGQSLNPRDVLEAVQLNKDLPSALKYLSHTCPICQEQVSFSKIVTMTHCSCAFCESCFKAYFSAAIKERTVDKLVCPLCSQPNIRGKQGMEEAMDYFNLLDTQIRHYLGSQSHELFQKKLRDRALQDMPNFCWCAHCSFGMLHEVDRLRMDCPNCKNSTCSQCRSPWFPEHQGVSCEEFKKWKLHNDPQFQAWELEHTMSRNKIECPNCRLVFYLSKGGCLHFRCSQCQHEFCGSCSRPFSLGSSCGFSRECGAKGLHAHHPRNCLYHLRDWSPARLDLLLQYFRVPVSWLEPDTTGPSQIHPAGVCLVPELPDDSSTREEPCGQPASPEHRGVCRMHYNERMVELIRRTRVDPAALYGRMELEAELQRWRVAVPRQMEQEAEPQYIQRLRMMLMKNIPLETDAPSKLKNDDHRPLLLAAWQQVTTAGP